MERKPGHSSLTVPYCLIKVKDSKEKDWVLQVAEIPPDYEREGVACSPYKLTTVMHSNGRDLVMVDYKEPPFSCRLRRLLTKGKEWNSPPVELNSIFVNKTIGTPEQLREYEDVQKLWKGVFERRDKKAQEELAERSNNLADQCFDNGAVGFKFGIISNESIKSVLQSKRLKNILAEWDGISGGPCYIKVKNGKETFSEVEND